MSAEGTMLTRSSVPTEVGFYTPKNIGVHKFEFFYGRDLLYTQGFFPVWTAFDIDIIKLAKNISPLTLIEHGWDQSKERGSLLFGSMDATFKRFATLDLQQGKRRHWFSEALLRMFKEPDVVGVWELHPLFAEYFLNGDGLGRGAFWYIYCLSRSMPPDEFITLLLEYSYKFRRLLDQGVFDLEALQGDNIVVHPDVKTFIFKDFMSARLCVATSSPLISQKIIEHSRQAGVVVESKQGDICLVSIDYLEERSRFIIRESRKDMK